MANGRAHSVPNASHLNEAMDVYGVEAALLQAILDIDDATLFDLPAPASQMADVIWQGRGGATTQLGIEGEQDARSNILAAAWFLAACNEMYQNEIEAVAAFYGRGPNSRIKALRVASGPYDRRRREWR